MSTTHPEQPAVIIGADIGGTSSRVAASADGRSVLSVIRGDGANPNSSGSKGIATLAESLRRAVPAGSTVAAATFGMAGAGGAAIAEATRLINSAWQTAELPTPTHGLSVCTDIDIAFFAGTDSDQGILLLSGTGSLGARFEGGALTQRIDGMGWLLGDLGSGLWIGWQGLRAAAAALDERGPQTALAALATARARETLGDAAPRGDERQLLIAYLRVLSATPAQLGSFCPVVEAAALAGDAVAGDLMEQAAGHLAHDFDVLAAGRDPQPVVFAGSTLLADGPVRRAVTAHVGPRAASINAAPVPLAGALVSAARAAGWDYDRAGLADSIVAAGR